MFLEALDKILTDHAGSAAIRSLEAGDLRHGVWQAVWQAGFADLLRSEAQGGAGLPAREVFPLLECLGRHAVPLPIGHTIVARGLLPELGGLPEGALVTLATQAQRAADGSLLCLSVPGGQVASHVLASDGQALMLMDCAQALREPVGDPRSLVAHLQWSGARPVFEQDAGGQALLASAAALTAALLSGGMQRAFEMALAHCNARVQFGKSIGKFQAVQHQISVMAEHVLAGAIAAESAFRYTGPAPALLAAAVAKSRASEAAAQVVATAHAVHGAMGMTDEFDLSLVTRRLHEWRLQYGSEGVWNALIGEQLLGGKLPVVDFVRRL
jgi:alkylation response protein AidB-like acyl-CoA dehydrogenase